MPTILISGVTGTLGKAILRAAVKSNIYSRVVGLSRDEVKQSQLGDEFHDFAALRLFLGDVRDRGRLAMAMRGVDYLIHAAALKRIDAGTYSPSEMIETNVNGTVNIVNAAIYAGVKRVVVVSSDKACAPTNLYGLTKGCAESYAVHANTYGYPSGTLIAAVRYGNILGSRGSVVPRWILQASRGERLTLTDAKMTRFIMTIEEAVALILYALQWMRGGEVFVPVLPTATMCDLATAVAPHVEIESVGVRPGGEKFAEALLNDEEPSRTRRVSSKYLHVVPSHHAWVKDDLWDGDPVTEQAQHYRSDNPGPLGNKKLSVGELRELLAATEAMR